MERDWGESKLSSFFLLALSLLSPSLPLPLPFLLLPRRLGKSENECTGIVLTFLTILISDRYAAFAPSDRPHLDLGFRLMTSILTSEYLFLFHWVLVLASTHLLPLPSCSH